MSEQGRLERVLQADTRQLPSTQLWPYAAPSAAGSKFSSTLRASLNR